MGWAESSIQWIISRLGGLESRLDKAEARVAGLEQQSWQTGGFGGTGSDSSSCIVRVTTQASAATAPAYSTGVGVLQYDGGSSPYADDASGLTISFKNDHDKNVIVTAHAKLLKINGDFWVIDVAQCADLT